jgi:hypothetical protein
MEEQVYCKDCDRADKHPFHPIFSCPLEKRGMTKEEFDRALDSITLDKYPEKDSKDL